LRRFSGFKEKSREDLRNLESTMRSCSVKSIGISAKNGT
jgi:hypothetical protein